jgi:Protein of unknown function (DUF2630)
MDDEQIHDRMEQLVAEEHELHTRATGVGLSESEDRRLESIRVSLDQAWDSCASGVRCGSPAGIPTMPRFVTRRSSSATSSSYDFSGRRPSRRSTAPR